MNTAETHFPVAEAPQPVCETCGTVFPKTRAWGRFCSTPCRNAFHGAERRKKAIRAKAIDLYKALAGFVGVDGPVGDMAKAAIAGLKPPVTPRELLEKSKA